ncbi:hypothetical protein [Aureivirga marina]|uniref:hypothetical protein n=1 Tax=Aureivirga marina TaxID=1182451 RepID=UPI0018CA56B4|nr:hypothetical protein [Aureivirga marina]
MKKYISIAFLAVAALFVGCNPTEDIYDELDAAPEQLNPYTLSEDDYDMTGVDNVADQKFFDTREQALELIPAILDNNFSEYNNGSTIVVTFDKSNSFDVTETLDAYTVTAEDYEDLGFNYPNFSNVDQIYGFLQSKYPSASRGTVIELTYDIYTGSVNTLTDTFVLLNEWTKALTFTNEQYNELGQTYSNFDNHETATRNIGIYLESLYPYAEEGDVVVPIYVYTYKDENDDRQYVDTVVEYTFNGDKWIQSTSVIEDNYLFVKNDEGKWIPDPTIYYTLTNDDYALVGNGNYNNFDIRTGKDEETIEARLAKIDTILKNNFPSTAVGQEYVVEYKIYDGQAGKLTMRVILDASGDYLIVE